MAHEDLVEVALATYNGQKHIEQLLDSVLEQSYSNWRLLVRDDCSYDDTPGILSRYADKYSNIVIIGNQMGNLGIGQNFNNILSETTAEYVMLADQDDVWLPNKIERSLSVISSMSAEFGNHVPLLVYTDLKVIDDKGQIVADSFWRYERLNPNAGLKLSSLLTSNVITGCTVIANRALLRLALPIPRDAIIHDWWLGLIGVACGELSYISEPLVLYRQHGKNAIGALKLGPSYVLKQPLQFWRMIKDFQRRIASSQDQASALLTRVQDKSTSYKCVSDYADLARKSFLERRFIAFKLALHPSNPGKRFLFYLLM